MNLCVTILANQDALVEFFLDPLPRPSISFGSNAKVFTTKVVKHKCVCASIVATKNTLPSFVSYRFFFNLLPAPGNVVFILTTLTAKLTLSPRKNIITQVPTTSFHYSRPLCQLSYRGTLAAILYRRTTKSSNFLCLLATKWTYFPATFSQSARKRSTPASVKGL